ncbi:hypothetical protein [Sphingobacterium paludis]|nr:hypothetical protein [Sphingobacterium paludis]
MYRLITLFVCIFLCSCYATKRLPDGTKVLSKKYKNIDKFDPFIYSQIDPNYFYKQVEVYKTGKSYKDVMGYWRGPSSRRLQFYDGGYIRILVDNQKESPDPDLSGKRGIIYMKNQDIRIDRDTADQDGTLQKQTLKVIVKGDKIYLVERLFGMSWGWSSNPMCYVFQKAEKVPEEWKQYKPDW